MVDTLVGEHYYPYNELPPEHLRPFEKRAVYAGSRLVQEYFAEIGQLHKCQGYDLALFTLRSLKKYYRLLSRIYLLVKCNLVVYGFEPGGKRTKEFLEETMDLMERTQKRIDTFAEDHMDE